MIDLMLPWQCLLILSIYPVFLMAMPGNMILVMYVILCILSYDFNKLTMLYIHVHISISMTNKSGLTFFLSIKYLSVCLFYNIESWQICRKMHTLSLILDRETGSKIKTNRQNS